MSNVYNKSRLNTPFPLTPLRDRLLMTNQTLWRSPMTTHFMHHSDADIAPQRFGGQDEQRGTWVRRWQSNTVLRHASIGRARDTTLLFVTHDETSYAHHSYPCRTTTMAINAVLLTHNPTSPLPPPTAVERVSKDTDGAARFK